MCCHQIHLNPLLGLIFFTNSHNISVTSWPFGFILLVTFLSCFMIGSLLCWWLIPLLVLWIFWEDPRNFCLTWWRNLLSASDSSNTFALALEFATICWISSFSASISAICRYQECFLCFWRNNFDFSSSALVFEPLDLLLRPDGLVMLDLTQFCWI